MLKAIRITVNGRVQGVGFRPFIFQLAAKYNIKGTVQNNMDGVLIVAEGEEELLAKMVDEIKCNNPRLSRIDALSTKEILAVGYTDFSIIPSERSGKSALVIPVDSAVCKECIDEMLDPANFRYKYPFINCTQCGPRYTIINELPYDRPYTSMNEFQMCEKCKAEYENPENRRHHAQPIACPDCGPEVHLLSINGVSLAKNDNAITRVKELLTEGCIIAIKGLGGYHLACDATNEEAILKLRQRKGRPNRPLAIMVSSLHIAKELCYLSETEAKVLQSPEAPIVVLRQKEANLLPKTLAPNLKTLGVMLPYTPLHYLLFNDGLLEKLVMTSANPSGMPILYRDEEAYKYLDAIADYVLTTNREILHPLDDSVVQIQNERLYFLRRSRGYVPDPITANTNVSNIIALGGQQKNTFALGRNEQIFIGPHIGDLENIEILNFFTNELEHLMKWMGTNREIIAVDKHPNYATNALAAEMMGKIIPVQHHHAHHVSCMADNKLEKPCYGIILDGTGYGEDGNLWGFEILYGDANSFIRLGHLDYTPLPGGEKAIKEPWRNAAGMLIHYFSDQGLAMAKQIFNGREIELDIISKMVAKDINSPMAGTCGRLFDAVSSILNVCQQSTYEGEAAIKLAELMPDNCAAPKSYTYILKVEDNLVVLDFAKALVEIIDDYHKNIPVTEIVSAFHYTIVNAIVEQLTIISEQNPDFNRTVVLSGGSFHNSFLLKEITEGLTEKGFKVYSHKQVPCNDGGIALGQLVIASVNR